MPAVVEKQFLTSAVHLSGILLGNSSCPVEPTAMPRAKPEQPHKTTSIILAKDLLAFFRDAAKQQDRSVTSLIRVILTDWAVAHGFRQEHDAPPPKNPKRSPPR